MESESVPGISRSCPFGQVPAASEIGIASEEGEVDVKGSCCDQHVRQRERRPGRSRGSAHAARQGGHLAIRRDHWEVVDEIGNLLFGPWVTSTHCEFGDGHG